MILVGGLRCNARESRERLSGTANPQHDAKKHGEHAERVIVGFTAVREELAPAVQVGELLHDPQRMHVVLHQVRRDRAEHRKSSRDTRDEGDGRRLVRFVGNRLVRDSIDLGESNTREQGIRVDRAHNRVVAHVKLTQLLTQELVAVDAHAPNTHDL